MWKKTKILVVLLVFVLQMVLQGELITLTMYASDASTPSQMLTLSESEKIKVEFYNSHTNNQSNTIYPNYRITNMGSMPIELSNVRLRYYYTREGKQSQSFWCDWSTVGSNNVTGTFMEFIKPHTNSNCYLEIGFSSGAGSLAPGATIEIKSRIAKSDWSNYSQINDYSFLPDANKYTEWNYVTAYINNTLVWGNPPEEYEPTPVPTPAEGDLRVEFYNSNTDNTINTVFPNFRITNMGTVSIELSRVVLRYYYTIDNQLNQNYWCDWSTIGKDNVIGTFKDYEPVHSNVDSYLEISFGDGAESLEPGESIEIRSRFANVNWTNYTQTNDYSFNSSLRYYGEWDYVTAYIDDILVWGIPPDMPTPRPTPTVTPTPILTPTSTPTMTPATTPTTTPTLTPTLTPRRTPGPSAPPGIGNGLRGEYYDNINFTGIKEIRIDREIDFDWGEGSPNANIGEDTFSVIWLGKVQPLFSEEYTFYTVSDERIRLWVDGVLLIDNYEDHTLAEDYGTIELEAGLKYDIRIEYCEKNGNAVVKLMWSSISQEKEIIPRTQLYPPKIFNSRKHEVRTTDKTFAIGDYVPLLLQLQVLWNIEKPVISVDMNVRKPDGTSSGFVLKEIMTGTVINKDMFKVYVNGSIIASSDFSIWTEGNDADRKLKIRVLRNFTPNDVLQIAYTVKVTATPSVFDMGIKEYMEANSLRNANLRISYHISERVDLGLVISEAYSKDTTADSAEKLSFQAEIKLEDPILLE